MWENFNTTNNKEFEINFSPHPHGGNDDILTICTLAACEWAENQLGNQPRGGIQGLSFWEVLEALHAAQLLASLVMDIQRENIFQGKM